MPSQTFLIFPGDALSPSAPAALPGPRQTSLWVPETPTPPGPPIGPRLDPPLCGRRGSLSARPLRSVRAAVGAGACPSARLSEARCVDASRASVRSRTGGRARGPFLPLGCCAPRCCGRGRADPDRGRACGSPRAVPSSGGIALVPGSLPSSPPRPPPAHGGFSAPRLSGARRPGPHCAASSLRAASTRRACGPFGARPRGPGPAPRGSRSTSVEWSRGEPHSPAVPPVSARRTRPTVYSSLRRPGSAPASRGATCPAPLES